MKDSTFSTIVMVVAVMIASLPFVMGYDNVAAPETFSVAENQESIVTLPFNADATQRLITGDITATNLVGQPTVYVATTHEEAPTTLTQLTNIPAGEI